jgi:hypothetical protein
VTGLIDPSLKMQILRRYAPQNDRHLFQNDNRLVQRRERPGGSGNA